jgi:hypothetical protein
MKGRASRADDKVRERIETAYVVYLGKLGYGKVYLKIRSGN